MYKGSGLFVNDVERHPLFIPFFSPIRSVSLSLCLSLSLSLSLRLSSTLKDLEPTSPDLSLHMPRKTYYTLHSPIYREPVSPKFTDREDLELFLQASHETQTTVCML